MLEKSPATDFVASGSPVNASWEHGLTLAISTRRQFRAEESTVELLLDDLRMEG
ncbi:hypothetical protein ACU4GI_20405 [Cupriavidus basilensis]